MDSTRKPRVPNGLHVESTDNGGFIVRHSFDNSMSGPSYKPDDKHAFTSVHQAHRHVKETMLRMSGVQSGGDDLDETADRKGKKDAKKAGKLGKDGGAEAGTGSPRGAKKTPPATSYGGTKKTPTAAQGRKAGRGPAMD